ncbi:hypothetical protein BG22_03965 [Bifidobacterium sp. UTBIF-78]|nr:hypothetical protein BG22_03965 [Bifidobacterium sp. UTBIF-78]
MSDPNDGMNRQNPFEAQQNAEGRQNAAGGQQNANGQADMNGQPNASDQSNASSQPNATGQPAQPQYGAYDTNHGGQYPPQQPGGQQSGAQPDAGYVPQGQQGGMPGAQYGPYGQDGQYGSGSQGQQPYYGPYATNPNGQSAWQYGQNPAYGQTGQSGAQGGQGENPFGAPNGFAGPFAFGNGSAQPGPGWYSGDFNPFRLIEEWLPQKAKTTIRVIYGVVGVAAIALGLALLFAPTKTLALAALLLGVYFVISGVVRIVSALVEPGLPGGWRVLDVLVGILLTFGGVVVVRNYGLTGQTLALLITLMVGFGWIMEGVMALVESWRIPHSGWAVAYAIISIIAGFVVLMSPLSSTVFMVVFGGCAMVVMGVTAVIRAFTFGKRAR